MTMYFCLWNPFENVVESLILSHDGPLSLMGALHIVFLSSSTVCSNPKQLPHVPSGDPNTFFFLSLTHLKYYPYIYCFSFTNMAHIYWMLKNLQQLGYKLGYRYSSETFFLSIKLQIVYFKYVLKMFLIMTWNLWELVLRSEWLLGEKKKSFLFLYLISLFLSLHVCTSIFCHQTHRVQKQHWLPVNFPILAKSHCCWLSVYLNRPAEPFLSVLWASVHSGEQLGLHWHMSECLSTEVI